MAAQLKCTGDASAGCAAFDRGRLGLFLDAQRRGSTHTDLLEPIDGGALRGHLTLENLGLPRQIDERIRRWKVLAWTSHGKPSFSCRGVPGGGDYNLYRRS